MNKKNFKLILIAFILVGIIATGYYFILAPKLNQDRFGLSDNFFGWKFPIAKFPSTGPGGSLAYSDIRDPGGIPQGLPVRLQIPIINVDSAIEDALITPDGKMDVPIGSVNVAWFALGPHPGQTGSAVIGGHFGISDGVPFVFYNLDKLRAGDMINIIDDKGDNLEFVVRSTKSFDRNSDATTVFTSNDGLAHLNLITCEGIWNQVNGTYPLRFVVFADAVQKTSGKFDNQVFPDTGVIETPTSDATGSSPISSSIIIQSIKSLFATPLDAIVTFLLISLIGFVVFKIIRR